MNDLQEFNFDGNNVRVITINGDPWWVLKDVCDVLGIDNQRNVAARLEDDEKDVHLVDTLGGNQNMTIINESGLYSVILRSDKPDAIRFRKWVTSEVLPSIRKTGSYAIPKGEELLALAVIEAERVIREKDQKIAILEPKAEVYEKISDSSGLKSLQEVSKILGYGPKQFFKKLRDEHILYMDNGVNLPYQEFIDNGIFVVREEPYVAGGEYRVYSRIFVTGKGELWLTRKIGREV